MSEDPDETPLEKYTDDWYLVYSVMVKTLVSELRPFYAKWVLLRLLPFLVTWGKARMPEGGREVFVGLFGLTLNFPYILLLPPDKYGNLESTFFVFLRGRWEDDSWRREVLLKVYEVLRKYAKVLGYDRVMLDGTELFV